jgi:hypothetical protein
MAIGKLPEVVFDCRDCDCRADRCVALGVSRVGSPGQASCPELALGSTSAELWCRGR